MLILRAPSLAVRSRRRRHSRGTLFRDRGFSVSVTTRTKSRLRKHLEGMVPRTMEESIEWLARAGHAAKGVIYAVLGLVCLRIALGGAGRVDGPEPLRVVAEEVFGQLLLILLALGLLVFVLWRFAQAIEDPERRGRTRNGLLVRGGLILSGLIYGGMAYTAAAIAFGLPGGGPRNPDAPEWTAWVMSHPPGLWLVAASGAFIILVGLHQFYRATRLGFMKDYMVRHMTTAERKVAKFLGRLGLCGRGAAFLLVGAFFIAAVMVHDPKTDQGLADALQRLLERSYGPWLLGLVALGFIAYAIYCFSRAQYRYVRSGV